MPTLQHDNRKRRVLIIVENLPVPFDRRVWMEATALRQADYEVAVICPKTRDYPLAYECIDGIHVYRHWLPREAKGILGYLLEYAAALCGETWLACKVWRRHGFDAIQACNPPDLVFLVAAPFKFLLGTSFVFDHHDPFPELFEVKFPRHRAMKRFTTWVERLTFRLADRVIASSEALRRVAMTRGDIPENRVVLVRSGIDLARFGKVDADPRLRGGRAHMVMYLGVIGSQDGVDLLLRAIVHVVHNKGRCDVWFVIAGDGPALADLRELAISLDVQAHIRFTGFVSGPPLHALLATADVGVCPDPPNAFNHMLSMNKIMEYHAFALPVVLFDLREGRILAGAGGLVAKGSDPEDLGERILELLDDPARRRAMGAAGRSQVEAMFAWPIHAARYLALYESLFAAKHGAR